MAKKTYKAKHRILLDAARRKYAEPEGIFQIEEKEGDRLKKLGAVVDYDAEKAAASKAAPKRRQSAKAKATEAEAKPEETSEEDIV